MSFSLPRSAMLNLLAEAMSVPETKRSAFLGRFQHLQRLKLIEGINPGRGKAAEYSAYQIVVIAIAMQMLQMGTTPDRAVDIIKKNMIRIQVAIGYAVAKEGAVSPSILRYDPAILSTTDERDIAHGTFDVGDEEITLRNFKWMFIQGAVERTVYISLSGTLRHIFALWDGFPDVPNRQPREEPETKIHYELGTESLAFMASLSEWYAEQPPALFYGD